MTAAVSVVSQLRRRTCRVRSWKGRPSGRGRILDVLDHPTEGRVLEVELAAPESGCYFYPRHRVVVSRRELPLVFVGTLAQKAGLRPGRRRGRARR